MGQPPPPGYLPPTLGHAQAPFSYGPVSVPLEIAGGFNWGAFWFSWIWGIAHNVWLSLLVFIVPWPIMNLVLGLKGNEWAWQNRSFAGVQQFKDTQRIWALWGWIVALISVALTLIFVLLWFALLGAAICTSSRR